MIMTGKSIHHLWVNVTVVIYGKRDLIIITAVHGEILPLRKFGAESACKWGIIGGVKPVFQAKMKRKS